MRYLPKVDDTGDEDTIPEAAIVGGRIKGQEVTHSHPIVKESKLEEMHSADEVPSKPHTTHSRDPQKKGRFTIWEVDGKPEAVGGSHVQIDPSPHVHTITPKATPPPPRPSVSERHVGLDDSHHLPPSYPHPPVPVVTDQEKCLVEVDVSKLYRQNELILHKLMLLDKVRGTLHLC